MQLLTCYVNALENLSSTYHKWKAWSDFCECNRFFLCIVKQYFVLQKTTRVARTFNVMHFTESVISSHTGVTFIHWLTVSYRWDVYSLTHCVTQVWHRCDIYSLTHRVIQVWHLFTDSRCHTGVTFIHWLTVSHRCDIYSLTHCVTQV